MNSQQSLHVVVRHPQAPRQQWANSWLDDDTLASITTTEEIGKLCALAMANGQPVLVHRCGWGKTPPSVCCTVAVVGSTPIDDRTSLVTFGDQRVLGHEPSTVPRRGQNYYWA
ncbi:MAG: hypothetical protein AB7Q17_12400 [Phycisphaerae bacterium]